MSKQLRVVLVGSTGLVGRRVIEACVGRSDVKLTAISRREVALPEGARMEMFVAEPDKWGEVIESVRPTALISALGTTWKRAGKSEEAFRAVDQDLVLQTAEAARRADVRQMVTISSVGADPRAKNFYLRVKGEVERDLTKLKFKRLDILRPGLLKGPRNNDARLGEGMAQIFSPLIDPWLQGQMRKYRSIDARIVAEAALGFAARKAAGRFTHEHDNIRRSAREWGKRGD